MLFVGYGWAEDHHDVEIVDDAGRLLSRRRLPEGLDGVTRFHALVAEQLPGDWADLDPVRAASMVKVGIETDRGPWVATLVAAGYEVFPITRCRWPAIGRGTRPRERSRMPRTHTCWQRSSALTARTRLVAGDTDQGEAIKLTARTHQSLIWDRTRHVLRLRSTLREYFPVALRAFPDLDAPDTLELPGRAPDPDQAAPLSVASITAALRHARRRHVETRSQELHTILRAHELRQAPVLQDAYSAIVGSEVAIIAALNTQIQPAANWHRTGTRRK